MSWSKYPIGTKAYSSAGGYWERVERGWKWCTGSTFPTPGGDVIRIEPPCKQTEFKEDITAYENPTKSKEIG